jgi:hypothetical protein
MKPFPLTPVEQHARFMAAICEDFATADFLRTGSTPRADRVAEIARQMRPFREGEE